MADDPPRRDPDAARADEARALLKDLERPRGWLGGSALADSVRQAADHFGGKDAAGTASGGGTDPIELWGRRIGRALSLVGFVALAIYLYVTYWR
ncbi:MAG: hypothetical protein AB7K64_09655 [Variibacter sp.]